MPKKKSSRPAASLGSNNNLEPKSAGQVKRERVVRIAAITIVLALLLSLLAGAFSVTPSQAAELNGNAQSVQILQADESTLDTDRDGVVNNVDPDIDGDGIANGVDPDIDGDGKPNFGDGDPAETNGIDGQTPNHPDGVTIENLVQDNPGLAWILALGIGAAIGAIVLILRRGVCKK